MTYDFSTLSLLFDYQPETGQFIRKACLSRSGALIPKVGLAKAGQIAGSVRPDGYVYIGFRNDRILAHRLAWRFVYGEWPDQFIDHIDGNPSNNRISNLRLVTHTQNMQNIRKPTEKNRTGFLGVSYDNARGKYAAFITSNGKTKNLGRYDTPEKAHKAYAEAKRLLHSHSTI